MKRALLLASSAVSALRSSAGDMRDEVRVVPVEADWDFDRGIVTLPRGFRGEVSIEYQIEQAGERIDWAFNYPPGYGKSAIRQALEPYRLADELHRHRLGRASHGKVRVINPA